MVAVVEHQPHLGGFRARALQVAAFEIAPKLVELADRLREVGIDGVELLDGRDAVASLCPTSAPSVTSARADAAADRRADGRVVEVELRARDVGLARRDVGLGLRAVGDDVFVLRLRGRLLAISARRAWPAASSARARPRPWQAPLRSPAARPRTVPDRSGRATSPALTSLPCSNSRATTMPETRARTSAMRVGAMRPGSSRMIGFGWRGDGDDADFGREPPSVPWRRRCARRIQLRSAAGRPASERSRRDWLSSFSPNSSRADHWAPRQGHGLDCAPPILRDDRNAAIATGDSVCANQRNEIVKLFSLKSF